MLKRFSSLFLLLALFLANPPPGQAQESGAALASSVPPTEQKPERYVTIRLLPEQAVIHPGEEIWVGIEQSIAGGWHTYWRNPGDSGTDTRIKWDLPAGFHMGDIQWPTPYKLPYGPMTNYGYADNVILLQKLKAPDTLPAGPLTLTAAIDVLVCHDICIPESGTYTMTLNAAGGESAEDNSAYLADAQSKLPTLAPERAVLRKADEETIEVRLPSAAWCQTGNAPCAGLELFPIDWGIVNNTAKPEISFDGANLTLRQQAGDRDWSELASPHLVIAYTNAEGQRAGMEFTADIEAPAAGAQSAAAGPATNAAGDPQSLPIVLAFALLGGLILNLMPCVFPVLSLKALSLVKIAEKHPREARMHGLAYTGGVILSFLAIAAVLIALKAGGLAVGWGFHLQNPAIIILLIYLLFTVGLNLMGFFEIALGSALGNAGNRLTQNGKLAGSFFTGVLATLVATPCTAPFMAAALGFSLTHSAAMALLVFAFLGLGLALPYLALSFVPLLQRVLPKPGAWMETFRQFLAFPVFLTCAWLLWVLSQQVGSTGILGAALGLTSLSFALWLGKKAPAKGLRRKIILALAILSVLAAIGFLPATRGTPLADRAATNTPAQAFGEAYTPAKLDEALASDKPVFVEMTAAWCITCKVNHATSLDIESTRQIFTQSEINFLVGDWTNYDPAITEYLSRFGRNGVPLYVYYAPPSAEGERPEPVVLPQILTPGIVAEALSRS